MLILHFPWEILSYSNQYLFFVLGPLTFTERNGKTTLYGVVRGPGGKGPNCLSTGEFGRVAEPSILRWIKYQMEYYYPPDK